MLRRVRSAVVAGFAVTTVLVCAALEPVDVNRATAAELMRVPGMTAVWAERIVRFRPYRTKLDLVEQGVLTPEAYWRVRNGVVAHRVALKRGE